MFVGSGKSFKMRGWSIAYFSRIFSSKHSIRRSIMKALFCTALLLLSTVAFAQKDKSQRPSPPASTQCTFADGKNVSIDYSRPSMKGRKVYGELVPFNTEWRTGANEATTFVVDNDVKIGSTVVPKGNYTLYTVPSENDWQLVISKKTGQWGIPYPGKEFDLARVGMQKSALKAPVQQFTINLSQKSGGCTLNIDWETTRASVDMTE